MITFDAPLFYKLLGDTVHEAIRSNAAVMLAERVAEIQKVDHDIRVGREKARKQLAQHSDAMAVIASETAAIQKRCEHPQAHFNPDPAGGSDSFHVCEICGAEW